MNAPWNVNASAAAIMTMAAKQRNGFCTPSRNQEPAHVVESEGWREYIECAAAVDTLSMVGHPWNCRAGHTEHRHASPAPGTDIVPPDMSQHCAGVVSSIPRGS